MIQLGETKADSLYIYIYIYIYIYMCVCVCVCVSVCVCVHVRARYCLYIYIYIYIYIYNPFIWFPLFVFYEWSQVHYVGDKPVVYPFDEISVANHVFEKLSPLCDACFFFFFLSICLIEHVFNIQKYWKFSFFLNSYNASWFRFLFFLPLFFFCQFWL